MKITVTKTVDKGIISFKSSGREKYGRELTGHTGEGGNQEHYDNGGDLLRVSYGNHLYKQPIDYPQGLPTDTAQERAEKLRTQIIMVRDWVNACKSLDASQCETATVDIPPTIESLQREIESLKRSPNTGGKLYRREGTRFVKI